MTSDLEARIQDLEEGNRLLRAEQEASKRPVWKVFRTLLGLAIRLPLEKETFPATRELLRAINRNLREGKAQIPEKESLALGTAVLRSILQLRFWAVLSAFVGLFVATLPLYLQWQNNTILRQDVEVARRAQLISLIYDKTCADLPLVACEFRADKRTRQEAVLAFVAMEASRDLAADLRTADLVGLSFANADLRKVNFHHADLRGANFYGADLRGANFNDADVHAAYFRGADLRKAVISQKQLNSTEAGDEETILPENRVPPPHWFRPPPSRVTGR